jgi:protocatechuate 3,4-dioxygenase beta subunit
MSFEQRFTRRGSLARIGTLVAAAAGGGLTAAKAEGGPAAVSQGVVSCVLTPELTEGPYYIAGEQVRRNITNGRPGTPLRLRLTVLDASTCSPIKGAAVDVWHADASGVYSGFGTGASNRTFMRGIQPTDANGLAQFVTVYPGWYQGRAVHIHVKVHVGGNIVHTGQLFFDDTITDRVYKAQPYAKRPNRDTRNKNDSIFVNGGKRSLLALSEGGSGWIGAIAMGVHRS